MGTFLSLLIGPVPSLLLKLTGFDIPKWKDMDTWEKAILVGVSVGGMALVVSLVLGALSSSFPVVYELLKIPTEVLKYLAELVWKILYDEFSIFTWGFRQLYYYVDVFLDYLHISPQLRHAVGYTSAFYAGLYVVDAAFDLLYSEHDSLFARTFDRLNKPYELFFKYYFPQFFYPNPSIFGRIQNFLGWFIYLPSEVVIASLTGFFIPFFWLVDSRKENHIPKWALPPHNLNPPDTRLPFPRRSQFAPDKGKINSWENNLKK